MDISYAITVCNERDEIEKLIGFLLENKKDNDEIIVLFDSKNGTEQVEEFLDTISSSISLFKYPFNHHFADWKNLLNSFCTKDYIFQIDADELPTEDLMYSLHYLVSQNVDVILVPRENTVSGLTNEHITKWNWQIDSLQRVNWPDYQWRIYRNDKSIKWVNKVHERLEGFKTHSRLPDNIEYGSLFLQHPKTIKRQEKQNNFYNTL
jgi:hypothetical protein